MAGDVSRLRTRWIAQSQHLLVSTGKSILGISQEQADLSF